MHPEAGISDTAAHTQWQRAPVRGKREKWTRGNAYVVWSGEMLARKGGEMGGPLPFIGLTQTWSVKALDEECGKSVEMKTIKFRIQR